MHGLGNSVNIRSDTPADPAKRQGNDVMMTTEIRIQRDNWRPEGESDGDLYSADDRSGITMIPSECSRKGIVEERG